jgi:hypothetical protein
MQLLNTLYVTTPESYVHLDNNTVRLDIEHQTKLRVPLHHLGAVVCFGHVSVSLPLMHRLAEEGVALVLLDTNGRFKARLEGAVSGTAGRRGVGQCAAPAGATLGGGRYRACRSVSAQLHCRQGTQLPPGIATRRAREQGR